jgi:hypothetical protein
MVGFLRVDFVIFKPKGASGVGGGGGILNIE